MPVLQTPEKGLNGWVHVVYAGTHTDKNGNTVTLSQADLDQVVTNHTPVPHVIGHPKENHPAYGWTQEAKRVGNDVFVKSSDVNADFSNAVESKAFPNRSASLVKTDKGWKLRHVGWLGAVPPALEKLHAAQFSAPEGVSFEFGADADKEQSLELEFSSDQKQTWIAEFSHNIKSLLGSFNQILNLEDAEKVELSNELESIKNNAASFSQNPKPTDDSKKDESMTTFTQEQLDAATAKAKEEAEAEFAKKQTELESDLQAEKDKQRKAEFSTTADKLISEHKLKPADKDAWVAFAMQCEHTTNVVEFSSGDGSEKKEQTAAGWFVEFSNSVTPFLKSGDQAGADSKTIDFSAKASAKAKELNISVSEAMAIVKREAGE